MARCLTDDDAETIALSLIADARRGDRDAIRLIWERLEGRPVQRQESAEPGTWSVLDLADVSTERIEAVLATLRAAG